MTGWRKCWPLVWRFVVMVLVALAAVGTLWLIAIANGEVVR